jgi:uncharacterized protein
MGIAMLKQTITDDMKNAMRAKEKDRLVTIRLILAAIKQIEVDERIELDDARITAILVKMVKQRKESITQFSKANRTDLVEKEQAEIIIVEQYLPAPLSTEEVDKIIADAITSSGASSIKEMGKVMGLIKPQLEGKADIGQVSQKIKTMLTA